MSSNISRIDFKLPDSRSIKVQFDLRLILNNKGIQFPSVGKSSDHVKILSVYNMCKGILVLYVFLKIYRPNREWINQPYSFIGTSQPRVHLSKIETHQHKTDVGSIKQDTITPRIPHFSPLEWLDTSSLFFVILPLGGSLRA